MPTQPKQPQTLHRILWLVQVLLSATLLWAASQKLFLPASQLARMWPWTADHTELVKLTGVLDGLAGLGLVLPALLRLYPMLTAYAALGTVALMVAAIIFHVSRNEASLIGINIIFALLALFVAWGRLTKAPIRARNTD